MQTFYAIEAIRLLVINCPKELDFAYASSILNKIYFEKDGRYASYNSLVNLSALKENRLNLNAYLESVQIYLDMKPKDKPVRIAILVRPEHVEPFSIVHQATAEFNNISVLITTESKVCEFFLEVDWQMVEAVIA